MDVDDHPNLKSAIQQAKDNDLIPIISNQAFELWYLLHFIEYSSAYIHRNDIYKKLDAIMSKNYDKGDKSIFELINTKGDEKKGNYACKKA